MADKKSFVIYDNWSRLFCGLPDETAGKLIKAVCAYKLGEGAEVNDPVIAAIYAMICEQLDADADKYADICEKRSQARKNKTQQMITNDNKCKQVLSSATDNDNDNDNENVKGNDNVKHKYGEYSHVKLTDKERDQLFNDYGEAETHDAIKYLDEYIEMKGYKAKSHYLCMRKWVFDAVKEEKQRKGGANDRVGTDASRDEAEYERQVREQLKRIESGEFDNESLWE